MAKGFSFEEARAPASGGFSFEEARGLKPKPSGEPQDAAGRFAAEAARGLKADLSGSMKNLVSPFTESKDALGRDARRLIEFGKHGRSPNGAGEMILPQDSRIEGSIIADLFGMATSPISGPLNAGFVQPGANVMDALPAPADPKTGKPISKEAQHSKNEEMFSTSLWGLGAGKAMSPGIMGPLERKLAAAAEKPAEAPKPTAATTASPKPKIDPKPGPEGAAVPPSAAGPKKRVRPPTTLTADQLREHATKAHEKAKKAKETADGLDPMIRTLERERRAAGGFSFEEARAPEELAAASAHRMKGQRTFEGVDAEEGVDVKPLEKSMRDIVADLNTTLGISHRQGRIGRGSSVLGIFKIKPEVVRTRAMHEMDVLSHEVGHALEFKPNFPNVKAALEAFSTAKGHPEPLEKHAYAGADPRALRQEGFAEFFRWYLTNPDVARKEAPQFYDAFEKALEADNPKVLESLRNIQAHYDTLITAPSAAVAESDIVDATPPGGIKALGARIRDNGGPAAFAKNFADWVYTGVVNRFHPYAVARDRLLQIGKEHGKNVDLETYQDPAKLFQMTPGARAAGHMDITHGVADYHSLTPTTAPLVDTIRDAVRGGDGKMPFGSEFDKRYKSFGAYLNARNMRAQWQRYMRGERDHQPDGRSLKSHMAAIRYYEERNPHWADQAQKVYDYANALWKKRFDAGFITKGQYRDGVAQHPDYVPAYRDMSNPGVDESGREIPRGGKGGGGDTGKTAGGVKRMVGSTRAVIDPLWSLGQQSYELSMLIARNDAVKALDDLANKVGEGHGEIYERIPAKELHAQTVKLNKVLKSIADRHGMSMRDQIEFEQAAETLEELFGEDAAAKIYRAHDTPERGDPLIYHWRKGKRIAGQLSNGPQGRMMVNALANMNKPLRGLWINILSTPARVLRGGVVLHPRFLLANIEGDQMTNAALNRGYIPFFDWIKGAKEEVQGVRGKSEVPTNYNRVQGAVGGQQAAAERQTLARRNLKELSRKGFSIVELPEKIATGLEVSETGSRLGLFMRELKKAEERGLTEWNANIEASHKARDVLDFDRRGGWAMIQAVTRMVPFLNANLQGVDKFFRTATPADLIDAMAFKPAATENARRIRKQAAWTLGFVGAFAAADTALRALYGDDPEYQDIADYLRQTHIVFKIPGTHDVFVYKKPFEVAALANFMERFYEATYLHDKTAMHKAFTDFFAAFAPAAIDPPILGIPWALSANKDPFGNPIIPPNKLGNEPRDQYNDYTPDWAIRVGGAMNMSPAQLAFIERAATGYYGSTASAIEDKLSGRRKDIEAAPPDWWVVGRFDRDITRGNNASKAFWNTQHEFGVKEKSLNDLVMQDANDKEAYKRLKAMTPEERGWVMLQFFGHGQEKQSHPFIHAQKAYSAISKFARDIEMSDVRETVNGPPIKLTPHQRREAIDALHDLNMAQLHDSLREMGHAGWAQAKPLDRLGPIQKLRKVDPALNRALNHRYDAEGVLPLDVSQNMWKHIRNRYERMPSEAEFDRAALSRRESGRAAYKRMLEQRR